MINKLTINAFTYKDLIIFPNTFIKNFFPLSEEFQASNDELQARALSTLQDQWLVLPNWNNSSALSLHSYTVQINSLW